MFLYNGLLLTWSQAIEFWAADLVLSMKRKVEIQEELFKTLISNTISEIILNTLWVSVKMEMRVEKAVVCYLAACRGNARAVRVYTAAWLWNTVFLKPHTGLMSMKTLLLAVDLWKTGTWSLTLCSEYFAGDQCPRRSDSRGCVPRSPNISRAFHSPTQELDREEERPRRGSRTSKWKAFSWDTCHHTRPWVHIKLSLFKEQE